LASFGTFDWRTFSSSDGSCEWGGGQGPLQPFYHLKAFRLNSQGFRGRNILWTIPIKGHLSWGLEILSRLGREFHGGNVFRVLRALLRNTGFADRDYQMVNAAKPGWNTVQEAQYFVSEGFRYKPDYLIVQFTLNDAEMDHIFLRQLSPFAWEKYCGDHICFLFGQSL